MVLIIATGRKIANGQDPAARTVAAPRRTISKSLLGPVVPQDSNALGTTSILQSQNGITYQGWAY